MQNVMLHQKSKQNKVTAHFQVYLC